MYDLLFKAASRTLLTVGERNLKCRLGFFAVLHSWGQTMTLHPHLHIVVPAVGIALDGNRIVRLKKKRFLLADKILSRVFRGKFISLLKRAYRAAKLRGSFDDFEAFLNRAARSDWVVRTKPPFGGPQVVLKYLARYTHRVAIGNTRIVSVSDSSVTFRYKDYRLGEQQKQMTISGTEFIRRFLLHLLPKNFVRVRYFGFLTRVHKARALNLLRRELNAIALQKPATNPHTRRCPHGHRGFLRLISDVEPPRMPHQATAPPLP